MGVWGSLSCPGGGSHCSIRIVCPPRVITDDHQRQAGPGKSRKPVHDWTCLEAVISTLTKFTGRPPAPSFLPSLMCGKNVILGAPTGIPHHRAGSFNRRGQATRGKAVFIRLCISETPNAPWGCLRAPAGRQVQRVLPAGQGRGSADALARPGNSALPGRWGGRAAPPEAAHQEAQAL